MTTIKYKISRKLRSRSERISMTVIFIFLVLFCAFITFPFLWMFLNVGKTRQEFFFNPFAAAENYFYNFFNNIAIVFRDFDYLSMLANTAFFTLVPPLCGVIALSGVSYAYAMFDFPGKKWLHFMAILPMIVLLQGGTAGKMKLWLDLGWYDNPFPALLSAFNGLGYNFLILSTYYSSCSRTYKEAAEIDGAGMWRIYLQIYFPMAVPLLTAFFVLAFIGAWNDYMGPKIYYPSWQTIATGIGAIEEKISQGGSQWSRDYPKLFTAIALNTIPCIILYASVQGAMRKMNIGGGIKG